MWDDQFEVVARHYRVIRYDIRGYGQSDPPETGPYYHVDDLMALLNFIEVKKAHVVGQSMGGALAAEFALAYPEAVSGLVLADAILWGYNLAAGYGETLGRIWEAGRVEGAEAARSLWLADELFAPTLGNPAVAARLRKLIKDYSGWHWTHDDPGLLPDPPAGRLLEKIKAPTLAIVGEFDLPDFHSIANAISSRVPGARKVVLAGAGHMSNMENPGQFNETVLNFLNDLQANREKNNNSSKSQFSLPGSNGYPTV